METKDVILELRTKKDCRKMNLQKKFMLQDKQYLVGKMEKQSPIQKR